MFVCFRTDVFHLPCVRDIDSPRSKCCDGKSICLSDGVFGWSSTHVANAFGAKTNGNYTPSGHSFMIHVVLVTVSNSSFLEMGVCTNCDVYIVNSLICTFCCGSSWLCCTVLSTHKGMLKAFTSHVLTCCKEAHCQLLSFSSVTIWRLELLPLRNLIERLFFKINTAFLPFVCVQIIQRCYYSNWLTC